MKYPRQWIASFIATFVVLTVLTGCWDRQEVETLAFITATGIDPVKDAEATSQSWPQIELSARIVNTIGSEMPGGAGGEKNLPSTVLTGRGVSPWNALLDIQKSLGWVTFIAHNRVLVVSSEIPKTGNMHRVIDFFDRSRQARRTAAILVADGLSAHDVVSGFSPLTGPGRSSLYDLIRTNHRIRGTPIVTVNDFLVNLSLEGIDPIAGRIIAASSNNDTNEGSGAGDIGGDGVTAPQTTGILPAELSGLALFQGERLVGFLEEGESQGLLWALGKIRGGFINIPCPGEPDLSFLFDVQRTTGRISTHLDPELKGKISIVMEGSIGDVECPGGKYNNSTDVIGEAHRDLKRFVENRVRTAVDKAQALQSDPFGFGAAVMRHNYRFWQEHRDRWYDSIWPNLSVSIDVEVHIRRPGLVNTPYEMLR